MIINSVKHNGRFPPLYPAYFPTISPTAPSISGYRNT